MRKTLLLFSLLLLCLSDSIAQCSDVVNTTTSTINTWDWRTRYWDVYYKTNSGLATYYNANSPFYDVQNQNLSTLADKTEANKDFKPEDGWELIKKDLGSTIQATSNPFVILYNKNTARLRVFFLVIQLYSEVGSNDDAKGGLIKVGFTNGADDRTYVYQSNLLATNTAPVSPLDQFNRDIVINTPNIFRSNLPYWLYADVPVMYDPCTCQNKGKLFLQAQLISTAQVDITINSLPYQSPVKDNAVNRNTDFLTAFTSIGTNITDQVTGGLKAANDVATATGKLVDGLDKVIDPDNDDLKHFYTKSISTFTDNVNSTGNWLELLPLAGGAAKSVVSLIDFFVSGGKKSGGAPPTSVIILNDFKAKGSITQTFPKNNANISLPGSDQTNLTPDLIPNYNNVLGIFNLLETPVINGKVYSEYESRIQTRWGLEYTNMLGRIATYQLAQPLKYVLNPALDIDYTISDINAALIFDRTTLNHMAFYEIKKDASKYITNLQQETSSQYRTSYYPISCLNSAVVKSRFVRYSLPIKGTAYGYLNFFGKENTNALIGEEKTDGYIPQNIVVKITARLRKKNATNPNEDIVFVSSFPTKFQALSGGAYVRNSPPAELTADNFEDIYEEDYTVPDNTRFFFNTTVKSLKNITIGSNVWIARGVNVVFQAGGAIIGQPVRGTTQGPTRGSIIVYDGTYNLLPNSTLPLPSACSIKQAPESATAINTFCNGSVYKVTKRYATARIGNEEEELIAAEEPVEELITFLYGVFPNPVNQFSTVKYALAEQAQARIYITNTLGNRVAVVSDSFQEPGEHTAVLDATTLSNGIYLCTLEAGNYKLTKRIVIIK